jgi:hypothetical protein
MHNAMRRRRQYRLLIAAGVVAAGGCAPITIHTALEPCEYRFAGWDHPEQTCLLSQKCEASAEGATGTVATRVLDLAGGVASNATVQLSRRGDKSKRSCLTSKSGSCTLERVAPGLYDMGVAFYPPYFKRQRLENVNVTAACVTTITVILETGTVPSGAGVVD